MGIAFKRLLTVSKKKTTFLLLSFTLHSFCQTPLAEQFKQTGFVEIKERKHTGPVYECLYLQFDALIEFLQNNPTWAQKLYAAKECFIRSKEKHYYSTDFFGFYDESKKEGRGQISFYYSFHFHEFLSSRYPEFNRIPEFSRFFASCLEIQKPYADLFNEAAANLNLETIFSSDYQEPPILFKVVKYLPSYVPTYPHYDGSAFSLFLDSTDNESLLLSPYQSSFQVNDFFSPMRQFSKNGSILLIPGTLLAEFSINPTPHIVMQTGNVRYAAIAFAMRPNYTAQKIERATLPNFRR